MLNGFGQAFIECDAQRLHACENLMDSPAPYLLTLGVSPAHGHRGGGITRAAYPQARAVVDDFGTLVCVEGWH